MSRFFSAIVICTLLYACKPGIPKHIIQPEEMEKILYDIHVIDGFSATFSMAAPDSMKKIISPYYTGVYKKHGIDSAKYNQSLNYYYEHPEVMKLMYDHVTQQLSKAKEKATKLATQPVAPANIKKDTAAKDTSKPLEPIELTPSKEPVAPSKATPAKKPVIIGNQTPFKKSGQ
jgi:hypothetical protein